MKKLMMATIALMCFSTITFAQAKTTDSKEKAKTETTKKATTEKKTNDTKEKKSTTATAKTTTETKKEPAKKN